MIKLMIDTREVPHYDTVDDTVDKVLNEVWGAITSIQNLYKDTGIFAKIIISHDQRMCLLKHAERGDHVCRLGDNGQVYLFGYKTEAMNDE